MIKPVFCLQEISGHIIIKTLDTVQILGGNKIRWIWSRRWMVVFDII